MPSYRIVLTSLLALPSLACGASYQRIYEGDVRFEHCYRLDADSNVSGQSRLACWSDWSRNHTAGQTLDRVAYAKRREESLRAGQSSLVGPSLVTNIPQPAVASQAFALKADSAPPSATAPASTSPASTSPATAPPAATTPPAGTGAVPASTAALTSKQQCSQECGQTFTTCVTRCEQQSCLQKCGNQAKVCIEHCL